MNSTAALAATLGLTVSELRDYAYQPTKSSRRVYAIGDEYFAVGKRAPLDDRQWQKNKDQFWGEQCNTIIWRAKS